MAFYDDMQDVATELLTEFGKAITFERITKTFDKITGKNTLTGYATTSTVGVEVPINNRLVDGSRIQAGDRQVIVDASYAPTMSDRLIDPFTAVSCDYPLATDDDLRAFVFATVSLTGSGADGRTVSWTPSGLDQAASASSGDAATTGSILMGTDTIWFEASAAQGSYSFRLSAAITDGVGTLITKLTGYSMSAISYDDHILTIGFNPDGSVVRKANGVENNTATGGPVTGEYFAPYILIYSIGNGVASSVTLRTSATEMQYAGAGVDMCGNVIGAPTGESWSIVEIQPIKPADTVIAYRLQVRK